MDNPTKRLTMNGSATIKAPMMAFREITGGDPDDPATCAELAGDIDCVGQSVPLPLRPQPALTSGKWMAINAQIPKAAPTSQSTWTDAIGRIARIAAAKAHPYELRSFIFVAPTIMPMDAASGSSDPNDKKFRGFQPQTSVSKKGLTGQAGSTDPTPLSPMANPGTNNVSRFRMPQTRSPTAGA
jgi:hypothetical protein